MTQNDWILIAVIVVAAAAIILHGEWRHRQLVQWLDMVGEMIGEWIAMMRDK